MTGLGSLWDGLVATVAGLTALLPFNLPPPPLVGYAEADTVRVGPELSGRLVSLAVARGSRVAPGAPLFVQDDTADQAALTQAKAQAAAGRAQLANLLTGRRPAEIDVVVAQLHEAEAQARLAERQLDRRTRLAETKVASVQELDIARADLDAAQARVRSLAAQVAVARLPARPEEVNAAQAQAAAADAAVTQAEWRLAQRRIVAPTAALVDDVLHWPGETVAAGAPVVSLLPPQSIKVRFYAPETLIATLRIGQTVAIACDGCAPDLKGHIAFIASTAEYTPPVIYSTGNKEKLVFLVEARPDSDPERLHPGQPVTVTPLADAPPP